MKIVKIIALLLILSVAFAFVSCDNGNSDDKTDDLPNENTEPDTPAVKPDVDPDIDKPDDNRGGEVVPNPDGDDVLTPEDDFTDNGQTPSEDTNGNETNDGSSDETLTPPHIF